MTDAYLDISLQHQQLQIIVQGRVEQSYPVSTAKNGAGQQMGSECTPLGWHKIRAKIGAGLPINSVFVGRRPTGEIYSQHLARQYPQRDWILSRILWLNGLEPGVNRYKDVDSGWRYIYIHGTPDHLFAPRPESHGCIRMKNTDIIDLFNQIPVGIKVFIH